MPVLRHLGRDDDMHGPGPSRADEVSLDIELHEIADAHWDHDQHLDCTGRLGLERASADVAASSGRGHQLAWQVQQRQQTLRVATKLCRFSAREPDLYDIICLVMTRGDSSIL